MKVASGSVLSDVKVIEPKVFRDARGFFLESYNQRRFAEAGIDVTFVQDNHARSARGTLRGLHFQRHPGQAKLVRAVAGKSWDVAVDIRRASPTFGHHVTRTLSAEVGNQLLVPAGFAHGFMTLEPIVHVAYKVSAPYAPETERAIRWDDPTLGIEWPEIGTAPLLSDKDSVAPLLGEAIRRIANNESVSKLFD